MCDKITTTTENKKHLMIICGDNSPPNAAYVWFHNFFLERKIQAITLEFDDEKTHNIRKKNVKKTKSIAEFIEKEDAAIIDMIEEMKAIGSGNAPRVELTLIFL